MSEKACDQMPGLTPSPHGRGSKEHSAFKVCSSFSLSQGENVGVKGSNLSIKNFLNHIICILTVLLTTVFTQPVDAKINVVTTIKPIHSLVAAVMFGVGEPHLLVESGSPHTYTLKPSNARALQSADLVVWIGPNLETFLNNPLKSLASKADIIALAEINGLVLHKIRNGEHGHGTIDPHIWLDPVNAIAFVRNIASMLSQKDSANTSAYNTNARKLITEINRFTKFYRPFMARIKDQSFLTYHDSYQYLERHFNLHLNYAGSITNSPDRRPGARHLKKLQTLIRDRTVKCIFTEPQFKAKIAQMFPATSKVWTSTLDPLGDNIEKGPKHYLTLLNNNAGALFSCLAIW
ncbi:MAG: zinc ABC transporter solute-binding protein [bacterium]|nr:zinc ABC transporter solute-binding protein [bacterium]